MARPAFWFAVAVHLVLATAYALYTPAFEAPDESDHFRAGSFLAHVGRMPYLPGTAADLGGVPGLDEEQVAHHPPLYYGILAGWMTMRGHRDTTFSLVKNPHFNEPEHPGRHLIWLHGCDETAPGPLPLLFELRLFSVLCGLITLLCTHRLGLLVFPQRPAIADLAALGIACLPMFSFVCGALDNGNLAMALSHGTILLLAGLLRRGAVRWRDAVAVGLLSGLALMTKLTAMVLLPLLAGVFLFLLTRRPGAEGPTRAQTLGRGAIALLLLVALTSWFFIRNASLYGDLLAQAAHAKAFQNIAHTPETAWAWIKGPFLPLLGESFLGNLGGMILPMPAWLNWVGLALLALSCLGLIEALARPSRRPAWSQLILLIVAVLGVSAIVVRFNMTFRQPQGRYLFSGLGPIMLLLGLGLHTLLAPRWSWPRGARALVCGLPALTAGLVLWTHARPALSPSLAPGDRFQAALVTGLTTPPQAPEIHLRGPDTAVTIATPPTFRWEPKNPDAPHEIHVYDGNGRIWIATHTWFHQEIRGGSWTMPAIGWNLLPIGVPLSWKVRQLPDRCSGETEWNVPASAPRTFTRQK